MQRFIYIVACVFLFQSCSDFSKNEKKTPDSLSIHELPCGNLSKEEIYEKTTSYVENKLGIKNKYKMKLEILGDTAWFVKLIPIEPQLGGVIELKLKADNCEISVLKLGK